MIITIKQATQNVFSRINLKIYKPTLFSIISLLSIFPCVLFLPEKYAWENSFIENIQLIIIAVCFVVAVRVKKNKDFFRWIAMICIILFLREINCGRIFFPVEFQVPNTVPGFKKWKEILPGILHYVPNVIYSTFIVFSIVYLFVSNAFRGLWNIVTKAKLDIINSTLLLLGVFFGVLAENYVHNEMLEEMTETLFYVAFTALVCLYGYNKDYHFTENKN